MKRFIVSHIACSVFYLSLPLHAQQTELLEEAKEIELASLQEGAETQERIDEIDDERLQMLAEYRYTLKQLDSLNKYNDHLRTLIASQEKEMGSLRSQINRVTGMERQVVPLMTDMLDTLEEYIGLDVPFLLEERRRRVARLRTLLDDPQISNSEKYRRILEAYQIENDYGRHIEAYEGTLSNEGDTQIVNFLKIGRVSFLYQTMDGEDTYLWNRLEKRWQSLDESYNNPILVAIRMARDQVPPNLIFTPVIAPDEA